MYVCTALLNKYFISDIRLNPALYTPCKQDIDEFCSSEMNWLHDDDDSLHGAVINCLKMEYLKGERSVCVPLYIISA